MVLSTASIRSFGPVVLSLSLLTTHPAMATDTRAETTADSQSVRDLPLPPGQGARYVGVYSVAGPGAKKAMTLHVSEADEALVGRINDNDPTRMLYQGGDAFRPEAAPVFEVSFIVEGNRASGVSIQSPEGPMSGDRIDVPATQSATNTTLHDTLARLDQAMFDASFVHCDAEKRNALFTDDVEFYHDLAGFSPAEKVRAPMTSCPAEHGMTRELVAGSLEAYPMRGYGAIQTGRHRFTEPDGRVTEARFVHLWRQDEDGWKIARVLSFDHQPLQVDAR